MKKRLRLFEFTEFLQATALKVVNDEEIDCIKVTVYGYTIDENGHIEFSYDIKFKSEESRDLTFEEITSELLAEDIKKIIKASEIPIKIN